MANADRPSGFRPIGNLYGAPYNGNAVKVAFADENAVATFIQDLVRYEGDLDTEGNPTVDQSADEDTDHAGVIVSFEPLRTALETKYRLASTERQAYMIPSTQGNLFVVQDDGSGTPAITWGAAVADIVVGSGNTTNGLSAMELLGSSVTSGANLQIVALYKSPDNSIADNADWIVRVNENSYGGDGTAS